MQTNNRFIKTIRKHIGEQMKPKAKANKHSRIIGKRSGNNENRHY